MKKRKSRRTEKAVVIDPRAFSSDGYLINQGLLSDVPFGRRNSRQTGCGWIACYNFLHFMGQDEDPLKVASRMEKMLLYFGYIGAHPVAVWWYLRRRGFRFRAAFTRQGMERLIRREQACSSTDGGRIAGILMYHHRKGSHYAAFLAQDGTDIPRGKVRFLNAVYGAEHQVITVKDFFHRYVNFPLVIVIVSRGAESGSRRSS